MESVLIHAHYSVSLTQKYNPVHYLDKRSEDVMVNENNCHTILSVRHIRSLSRLFHEEACGKDRCAQLAVRHCIKMPCDKQQPRCLIKTFLASFMFSRTETVKCFLTICFSKSHAFHEQVIFPGHP